MEETFQHVSVLQKEAIEWLQPSSGAVYVDCTLGGAGHSRQLLAASSPDGKLIAIDQDPYAIRLAQIALQPYEGRFTLVHSNFERLDEILLEQGIQAVDGILFDLGVSSPQLDQAERGFSYQHNHQLDMRMNTESALSAYEVVNRWSESELAKILWEYGEEKWSKRIAEFIVKNRTLKPVQTTFELVDIIKQAIPAGARREGPHPAKRTFQAIRIAVNDELGVLERALQRAMTCLLPSGRLAVITFHSLEDRMVKEAFQQAARGCVCPPKMPICTCGKTPDIKILTRKPILPSADELEQNPRARSAKLRVVEKLA